MHCGTAVFLRALKDYLIEIHVSYNYVEMNAQLLGKLTNSI